MRAFWAVVAAAICFGTTGTAQALADVDGSATSVGLARIALGGGLLALWALLLRTLLPRGGPAGERAPFRRGRTSDTWLVAVGALGVLAYQPAFFAGTRDNGVAVGTVVALGSAPLATGLLDAVVRHRAPDHRWRVATGIALLGLVLVAGVLGGGRLTAAVLWSVGAGVSYAVYAVAGKALIDRGWSSSAAMGAMFGAAAVVALPLLVLTRPTWLYTPAGLALALWLGLVTTTIAYLLFGWGLARLPAPTVSTLTLAEPLCATTLGVLVLGEQLGTGQGLGMVMIGAALALLAVPQRRVRVSAAA